MRHLWLGVFAALTLTGCATTDQPALADVRVCEVLSATTRPYMGEPRQDMTAIEFQRLRLLPSQFRCGRATFNRPSGRNILLIDSVGFSADGRHAEVQISSGVTRARGRIELYSGNICWLNKEEARWRQVGCTVDWEF